MSLNHLQTINFLRETARTASIPWPSVILATVSTVVQAVADAKNTTRDLQELMNRLVEIVSTLVPALSNPNIVLDEKLSINVRSVVSSMSALGFTVQKQLSRSKIHSFLSTSSQKLAIKQAERDMELAIEGLNLCLSLSNLRLVETVHPVDVEFIRNELEAARTEQLEMIREEVQKNERDQFKFSSQVIPMVSGVFFGRDVETEHILSQLDPPKQALVAILGSGGIGKTSLVLSILHNATVADRFGDRRYFIACDAADTPEGVSERFAQTLGLPRRKPALALKKRLAEYDQPVLIAFDNFETPWEPTSNRLKLETFLCELAGLPQVSLMVTMRGAERPSSLAWSKPFLPPLQPLDLESAKRVFISISDAPEGDPYVESLIRAVDMVPLAVTLLATQAQYMSCKELLDRWNDHRTKMVSRGYDDGGRLWSLDASIQLSLSSSRFKEEPAAMRLLQVLSILPDGAPDSLIATMAEEEFPLQSATAALLRVSLASRGGDGYLRVLSPVREHIQMHSPLAGPDLALVFGCFRRLLLEFNAVRGTSQALELIASWTPQIGNLQYVLRHCLSRPSDVDPVESTEAVYHSWTMLRGAAGLPSLQRLLADGAQLAHEQKLAIQEAKLLLFVEDDIPKIDEFISVLRSSADPDALMLGLREKGAILHYVLDRADQALSVYEEAWRLDHSKISKPVLLPYYALFGEILVQCYQPVRAKEILEKAWTMAEQGSFQQLAGQIGRFLASHEKMRGNYSASHKYIQASLNTSIQADLQMASILIPAARLVFMQGRFDEAEQLLHLSLRIFQQLDRLDDWGSTSQRSLLSIYIEAGRLEDAASIMGQFTPAFLSTRTDHLEVRLFFHLGCGNLQEADHTYHDLMEARNKERTTTNNCYALLAGDLFMRSGRIDDAMRQVSTLLVSSCKGGYRLGVSMTLLRLGDILRVGMCDMESARNCYEASFDVIKFLGVPRHKADILFRVADSQARVGDLSNAQSGFSRARRLFERSSCSVGAQLCDRYLELLLDQSGGQSLPDYFAADSLLPPTLLGYEDFW